MSSKNGAKRMVKRVESVVVRTSRVGSEREPVVPILRPRRAPAVAPVERADVADLCLQAPELCAAAFVRRRISPSRKTLARYRQSSPPRPGILLDTVA